MRPELTQLELSRLSTPQLVEYGKDALRSGSYGRAACLLREAVRRAPMRADLKDWLGQAVEGSLMENPEPRPARPEPRGRQRENRQQPPEPRPAPERRDPREIERREYPIQPEHEETHFDDAWDQAPPPRPRRKPEPEPEPEPDPLGWPDPRPLPRQNQRPEPRPEPRSQPRPEPRPDFRFDNRPEQPRPPEGRGEPRPVERPRPAAPRPAEDDWYLGEPEPPRPEGRRRPAREPEPYRPEPEPPPERPRRAAPREAAPAAAPPAAPRRPQAREAVPPQREAVPPATFKPQHGRPSDFNRRHQRGPIMAYFFGAFMGFAMCVLLGGVGWFYLKYNNKTISGMRVVDNTADLNVAAERAETYTRKGEYSKATEVLLALPESSERNRRLAEMYSDQGDQQLFRQSPPRFEGAIKAYDKAVSYDPTNPQFRNHLAEAYYQFAVSQTDNRKSSDQMLDLAQQNCEGVLSQDTKNLEALKILGRVAVKKRDDVLLSKTLNRIISAAPDSPDANDARQKLNDLRLK